MALHDPKSASLSEILQEIVNSASAVIKSDARLLTSELKDHAEKLKRRSIEMIVFGMICSLSIFPVLAFLILGLGKILNDRYWLSSLIVALIFGGIGGALFYRAYNRLKQDDFSLLVVRKALGKEKEMIEHKGKAA
jgi:drug/metabolite transporter (DMT)-like permease